MTAVAQSERQALCRLLEDEGPLAPTLCEGWTTSDLAAHLFVRERRPLASPGIIVSGLARLTERAMDDVKGRLGYEGLIAAVRAGPPFPFSLVDSRMNLLEYFVHHEDVRRAVENWEPRSDSRLDAALWPALRMGSRLLARRLHGAGIELQAPGFGGVLAKKGLPLATVRGGPQELALFMTGRQKTAIVDIDGADLVRGIIDEANFGL